MRRYSERAVALIMTLIMLSVITVMAVAFLALTQRERTSVSQSTYQSEADMMADAAYERAKGTILAQTLASTNLLEADFMVSRNFINTNGFDPNLGTNLINVNYDYTVGGGRLSADETRQTIANLFFDPRPPVFINTNVPGVPEESEFRFYLDLNRNRHFDTNGILPELDDQGRQIPDQPWLSFTGDPEWIGVLENPNFPHSRSNKFIGRYAYIALPIGKSLDVNHIHNQARDPMDLNNNWFNRNQGYGSWELNLAAFLVDLNTNAWQPLIDPYLFNTNESPRGPSRGKAFNDAREILTKRWLWTPASAAVMGLNQPANNPDFLNDNTDNYANGPLDVFGRGLVDQQPNFLDDPTYPAWPGAWNPTNYYTPHDFFELFPPTSLFVTTLRQAGAQVNSYDRYTFYRMLAQLSTGSAGELSLVQVPKLQQKIGARLPQEFIAEPLGKININYDNVTAPAYEMRRWTPNAFFNTVADVLIRAQFPNAGVSNLVATNYNFIVHRLLQVAANIYDTTRGDHFPSVFRPNIVLDNGTNIIRGYYEDSDLNTLAAWQQQNRTGVPMVIGSKKYMPNFNEYVLETVIGASRKLEFVRTATNVAPNVTNQMYMIGISNFFAAEAWNSYTQNFFAPVTITVSNWATLALTNQTGILYGPREYLLTATTNILSWSNYPPVQTEDPRYTNSFVVPFRTNIAFLPDSIFRFPNRFEPLATNALYDPTTGGFPVPDWQLVMSNRLIFVMSVTNRIIDYVDVQMNNMVDITRELGGGANRPIQLAGSPLQMIEACWSTARGTPNGPPDGLLAQINISLDRFPLSDPHWKNYGPDNQPGSGQDREKAIHSFKEFMFPNASTTNANLRQQAPYTPGRKIFAAVSFEANDPLVHHMVEHLIGTGNYWDIKALDPAAPDPTVDSLGDLNWRYRPWGGSPKKGVQPTMTLNPALNDPGVRRSDNWDFPTNKFPNIGWLGKVHRGTPWQTIYLKAATYQTNALAPAQTWRDHFFDTNLLAHPSVDWGLLDVFTTAVHPNASHGQLSINQTNFAAWSAVLSGVSVLQNRDYDPDLGATYDLAVIEPNSAELRTIYDGIQRVLESKRGPNKDLARTFRRLGDILEVEELTVMSPFLNPNAWQYLEWGISDAAMERIPQQILSLLKVGDPRYVVYAFGQSLRPAEQSILTSGPYIGMCTNYQITGEAVTRTVLQVRETAAQPRPVIETFNILRTD